MSHDEHIPLEDKWATVQDLADLYSMSAATVRKRAASGKWPAHRQGKTLRFSPDDQQCIRDLWQPTRPQCKENRAEQKARREWREKALQELIEREERLSS